MNSKDLPLTIADTQKALKKRALSAVELTQSYLSRIKTNDSSLNSFITVCEDKARRSAARVDKTIKELGDDAFQKYPLLGAVVAHKDMYLTKGVRTTAGSKVLESYIPQYSASVVERIEKAGAIMIGKTNQDAWAHGSSGENSDFGPTKNPWNREYVPGGSSSGSAAAVSADFATLATSTDTCGSTRLPANFCGVVGLKPTYGAISRYGVVAMASSLDSMGNITKTVGDSKKVFDVTKGEDKKDSTVKLADGKRNMENGKYTIGIPKEFFGEGLEGCVREKIYEAIDIFKKAGVEFKDVSLPHTKYAISAYYIICRVL
jgi:aspartyl-tRNA(Asn)/glutamyl-tRNA(Gln) amidotransferase subunit A